MRRTLSACFFGLAAVAALAGAAAVTALPGALAAWAHEPEDVLALGLSVVMAWGLAGLWAWAGSAVWRRTSVPSPRRWPARLRVALFTALGAAFVLLSGAASVDAGLFAAMGALCLISAAADVWLVRSAVAAG